MSVSHQGSFNGHISICRWSNRRWALLPRSVCRLQWEDLPQLACSTGRIGHNGYELQQRREGSSLWQYRDGVPNLPLTQFECTWGWWRLVWSGYPPKAVMFCSQQKWYPLPVADHPCYWSCSSQREAAISPLPASSELLHFAGTSCRWAFSVHHRKQRSVFLLSRCQPPVYQCNHSKSSIGAHHPVSGKSDETWLHSPREHAVQHDVLAIVKREDCEPLVRSLWYLLCLHHRWHHRCCMCRWLINEWKINNFRLGCQRMTLLSKKLGVVTIEFRTFVSGDNLLNIIHKRRVIPASDKHMAYKQTAKQRSSFIQSSCGIQSPASTLS